MQSIPHKKLGYTLVEMLAVISIMGVLAGMGVVGFQTMVSHTRTKDAALNVAAYLERTANKARQLNETLCVRKGSTANVLETYKASCATGPFNDDNRIDRLVLEDHVTVLEDNAGVPGGYYPFNQASYYGNVQDINLIASEDAAASFAPRQGLSSAPNEGYIVLKYSDEYGAIIKEKTKNVFQSKWCPSGTWSDL